MPVIGVNIALFPPSTLRQTALRLNQQISETNPSNPIRLEQHHSLPHLTLTMGFAEESQLSQLTDSIKQLVRDFSAPQGTVTQQTSKQTTLEQPLTELKVEGPEIHQLHEIIYTSLQEHLSYTLPSNPAQSPDSTPLNPLTHRWIAQYPTTSALDKYRPHITLGFGKLENQSFDRPFTFRHLILCQMGNYCTCEKLLHKEELSL